MQDTTELRYTARLKCLVDAALQCGGASLLEVTRRCRGAYPTLVRDVLESDPTIAHRQITEVEYHLTFPAHPPTRFNVEEIEQNPLLSAWYFTDETAEKISCLREWAGSTLAFLGTPKLFEYFEKLGLGNARTLVDCDEVVISTLRGVYRSAADRILHGVIDGSTTALNNKRFDFVFFDPPWYLDDYFAWLRTALLSARHGVVFSLMPEMTRPNCTSERQRILELASKSARGIIVANGFIEYEIPTFERNQLEACGIELQGSWKYADLVIIERGGARPDWDNSFDNHYVGWVEVDTDGLRWFINVESPTASPPGDSLLHLAGNSIFLSNPSKRNPERSRCNVITSRGHGFSCTRPIELFERLKGISAELAGGASVESAIAEHISSPKDRELISIALDRRYHGRQSSVEIP